VENPRLPAVRGVAVVGLVLAAGEGRRLGQPKALVTDPDGRTWVRRTVDTCREGGVGTVYVVVGAAAADVRREIPEDCVVVVASDWAEGMGESLKAGLAQVAADQSAADAVVVTLVDTPGVTSAVVRRLARTAEVDGLARASYDGVPGHPVVLGRSHWPGVLAVAAGDRGARDYLKVQHVSLVECRDVGSGADIDTLEALGKWTGVREPG